MARRAEQLVQLACLEMTPATGPPIARVRFHTQPARPRRIWTTRHFLCEDASEGAVDLLGNGCDYWLCYVPDCCLMFDDDVFAAMDVCCACSSGGRRLRMATTASRIRSMVYAATKWGNMPRTFTGMPASTGLGVRCLTATYTTTAISVWSVDGHVIHGRRGYDGPRVLIYCVLAFRGRPGRLPTQPRARFPKGNSIASCCIACGVLR